MKLPVDMFKLELLPYLTVHDIGRLDSAFMNHEYRPQFLEKISGGILRGDNVTYLKGVLLEWLHIRSIYLINVVLSHHLYYLNIFKYTEHIVIKDSDLLSQRENRGRSFISAIIYTLVLAYHLRVLQASQQSLSIALDCIHLNLFLLYV
jgi:hypothetical protein